MKPRVESAVLFAVGFALISVVINVSYTVNNPLPLEWTIMPSVVIDLITIALALYALVLSARALVKPSTEHYSSVPVAICIVYLVAQSEWTAAFLTENLWGAKHNNYIWFLFNSLVFIYIIKGAKK